MTDKRLYVTGLRVSQYAGLREFELTPKQITVIAGPNGTGKTSVINAIKAAVERGGITDEAIRTGADKAEIVVELTDGTTVKRSKAKGKAQRLTVSDAQSTLRAPQKVLSDLLDPVQLDPVAWLSGDRTAALLDSMPLRVTAEQIHAIYKAAGVPASQRKVPDGIADRHALEVLAELEKSLAQSRTAANAEVKQLAGWVEQEQKALEETVDPTAEIDRLQEDQARIAGELGGAREAAQRIADAKTAADTAASANKRQLAMLERLRTRLEEKRRELEQAEQDVVNADAELASRNDAFNSAIGAYEELMATHPNLAEGLGTLRASADEITTELETLKEQRGAWAEAQAQRGRVKGEAERLERLREEAKVLNAGVKAFRDAPADLLAKADLPVNGLAYTDGTLTLNGVAVAQLSGAETMRLAVKIAHHRVKERQGRFVLMDGLEQLDNDQRAAMLEEIRGSDVQWLITEVGLRGNGDDVQVVVMRAGEAEPQQESLDVD